MGENQKGKVWHGEVITPAVEQTLQDLKETSVLENFYLAGGTGLALQVGHRKSVDLDFFSRESFNEDLLLQRVQNLSDFALVSKDAQTLHAEIRDVKVSFLGFSYPLLFPFNEFLGVNVADAREIACMKVNAISGRGTRRDFIDLYVASQEYGLGQIMEWFKEKYTQARYSMVHVLKSLTYFDEAEKDPMPGMLTDISWEKVKNFFVREVQAMSR